MSSSACTAMTPLWGRYWGRHRKKSRIVHFEVCYYAPIEWGIHAGASFFRIQVRAAATSAGAAFWPSQGAPCTDWSDPRFDSLLRAGLPPANAQLLKEIEAENAELPQQPLTCPLQRPRGPWSGQDRKANSLGRGGDLG